MPANIVTRTLTIFLPLILSACLDCDRVGLMADTQNAGRATQRQVAATIAAREYDYLLIAGDVVNACVGDRVALDWNYHEQLDDLLAPLVGIERHACPGNHDYGNSRQPPQWKRDAWRDWVGPRYHAFTMDYVCFFLVDDYLWDEGQAAWLHEAVAACDRPWRVLVKHHPLPCLVDAPGCLTELNPERYAGLDVGLVLAGHQHAASAWEADGMLNVTLPPTSFAWFRSYDLAHTDIMTQTLPVPGFGELEACADRLVWRLFGADGTLLLQGVLEK